MAIANTFRLAAVATALTAVAGCVPQSAFEGADGPTLTADAAHPIVEAEYFACLDGYDDTVDATLRVIGDVSAVDGASSAALQIYGQSNGAAASSYERLIDLDDTGDAEEIDTQHWVFSADTGRVCTSPRVIRLRHFDGGPVRLEWSLEFEAESEEGFEGPHDLEITVRPRG
ncbi:MAG: hypothetical protein AAF721_10175 [Myxococcota bacterium]